VANLFIRAKALFAKVEPLESDKAVKAPRMDDVATYEKSTIGLGPRYTPDLLVRRNGISIYEKMRIDEQVKAVMNFKRDAITARGWTFKYEDESSLNEEERGKRIRVFTEIFHKMRGSFVDALNVIATGRDYGFSLTEKVYSDVKIDKQTYIGLNMLLGRDPSSFEFWTDDYGILNRVEQVVPGKRIVVDMGRMIHYVHSPEFDRYYGRSDLREAYRAWFIKQRVGEFWALYLERMAGGFLMMKKTADSSMQYGSAEQNSLQDVLTNLHSASGIILPAGIEPEMIQPATTDAFERAMVFWDLAIAKALLVPNLLGISHTGQTGAFAQSQTQLEAFFWTLNADSERLEATINEQLVQDLGDQNFGDGDYPYFCFKPASIEHIKRVIDNWKVLVDAKSVITSEADEEHFRKLLDMPKRDEDTEPLIDPLAQQQQTMAEDGQGFDQQMRGNQDKRAQAEADRAAKAETDAKFAALNARFDTLLTRLRPTGVAPHVHVHAGRSPGYHFEFNPDQPRADDGEWTDGGGGSGGSLSDDEHVAVTSYREDGYGYVNSYVAGKTSGWSESYKEQAAYEAAHLESAINKSPLAADETLYRGFSHVGLSQNAEKLVGREIGADKFLSTSREKFVAESFASKGDAPVVFRIRAPKGTRALDMDKLTGKANGEKEVLLSHRAKIRITGVTRGRVTYVDGEITG